jgi:hypothetical protein
VIITSSPASVSAISLSAGSVIGGTTTQATVTLNGPAPLAEPS